MTQNQIEHKQNKAAIRTFMREHYTDERLTELLAHAQDGKLSYQSCCCFIGISTANHALRSVEQYDGSKHFYRAERLRGATGAENAFADLGHSDGKRRRILIPIVKAEIRRRDRAKRSAREDAGFARLADECNLLELVEPKSGDIARSLIAEMESA